MTFGVHEVKTCEVYQVREKGELGGEWGTFFINETHGEFMAQTSFGDYCYRWNAIGNQTLKQFLSGLDMDYAMTKFRGRGWRLFCPETTLMNIKRDIFERRRDKDLTKDEARSLYDDAVSLLEDDLNITLDLMYERIYRDTQIMEKMGYDDGVPTGTRICGQCQGFWDRLFIPFMKWLRENGKLDGVKAA